MHEYNPREFEAIVKSEFSFLMTEKFGYKGLSESAQNLLGRSCTSTWENPSTKRALKVKYIESKPHAPMGTLLIEIVNLDPPELDQDDYTTLSCRDVTIPRLSELEGSFEKRVQECIAIAKALLNGELSTILFGKAWVASTFDWAGMK